MRAFKLIFMGFSALLGAAASLSGLAAAPTVTVVEYYDTATRKFFMTADPAEQVALDASNPDSTRVRTGLEFDALPADVETCELRTSGQTACAGSIVRFDYAAFDWFFYSPKPSEWALLKDPGSGFIDRGVAFKAFLPDGPGGTCTQGRVPVFRSYRNQNHRFPADQATHQRMITTGSQNEGITFCAESARIRPLLDATFSADQRTNVLSEDQCPVQGVAGSCLVARNLQPPRFFEGDFDFGQVPAAFFNRTGFNGRFIFTEGDAQLSDRAFGTFVQFGGPGEAGLHVNWGNRNFAGPASLDATFLLPQFTPIGDRDRRLLPFLRGYDVPVELAMRFQVFVKAVDIVGIGTRVSGNFRIFLFDNSERRFNEIQAERRMDFVVQVYGDDPFPVDTVTREGVSIISLGRAVVTTRIDSPSYGRQATSLPYLATPGGFVAANPWGYGGTYEYRLDRAALQRIIDAARTIDPNYSADASQYQVLGYRFENQVDGPARLGVNERDISLQLVRRP